MFAALIAIVAIAGACSQKPDTKKESAPTSGELKGLFRIEEGVCTEGAVTKGSYFRMINPGGKPDTGPFVTNGDSQCKDKTFSPLSPGTDGGLKTGAHQPNPEPAFDGSGNAMAASIAKPVKWFAVNFALASNPKDPQTGVDVPAPTISFSDGKLSGDLRAIAAAWNKSHFNQGAPKPDGQNPGITSGPTGTYDPATKRFTIAWVSQIVGGGFNNFSGTWHLEGVFEPS